VCEVLGVEAATLARAVRQHTSPGERACLHLGAQRSAASGGAVRPATSMPSVP
jgi:hypothetical protein